VIVDRDTQVARKLLGDVSDGSYAVFTSSVLCEMDFTQVERSIHRVTYLHIVALLDVGFLRTLRRLGNVRMSQIVAFLSYPKSFISRLARPSGQIIRYRFISI
jgi:hypothetical protein